LIDYKVIVIKDNPLKYHMKKRIKQPRDLIEAGLAPASELQILEEVAAKYTLSITPEILEQAARQDNPIPILRQFIPSASELETGIAELPDPTGDEKYSPVPGIVHRYRDRVLLKASHICPVYCRFCFRREYVGDQSDSLSSDELNDAINYIDQHPEVWEVILSGGDPLAMSNRRVRHIIERLHAIKHVEIIRIHTRVPVVAPELMNNELIETLRMHTPTYLVLHVNRAEEIGLRAEAVISNLADVGIPLLSQTVLLQGINNNVQALEALFRKLVRLRIKPYYLHHLDPAPGTAHFRVSVREGQSLLSSLRGDVSGLCQPTYVVDIPGGFGKVPIGPRYEEIEREQIRDVHGELHSFVDLLESKD
jgi:lysine 2,3-aminomutase